MSDKLPAWDLTQLYPAPDSAEFERDVERIIPLAEEFERNWRGKLAVGDGAAFAKAITECENVARAPAGPYAYAHLRFALDSTDQANVALLDRVRRLANEAHRKTIFFNTEPDALDDKSYLALVRDPRLRPWAHYLFHARILKKFRLSEKEESLIALKALSGRTAFVSLYSRLTSAMRFPSPLEEGRTLTNPEVLALQKHPDRGVRRKAMETFAAEYEKEKLVISSAWNAIALDHAEECKLRNYGHPMMPTNIGNELSQKAVDALMEVTRRHYPLARRYYEWKAKKLGVEKLWSTDLVAPLPGVEEEPIPFAKAKKLVLDSFDKFSPGFGAIARDFFVDDRVDAAPRQGKSGGAFCMAASPDLPVFVLMNYTGKMRDVATLAHELGHGIHFTMARKQPLFEYDPVLPMAEMASVFAELLLMKKLMAGKMDAAARQSLLADKIEDIIATTFRQAMYTDFELAAHLKIAQGALSPEQFCEIWGQNLEALYGDSVEILPGSRWTWSAIPHFVHTRFYCYAYTFGELLVLAFYKKYLEEGRAFVPKLVKILEAGGSRSPAELAAEVGYNLEDPTFWEGGYQVLEELINELEGA